MATIELYKDKINSMSNYIEQAKSAVSDFCVDLSALKKKVLGINSSVCDGIISKISTSSQTQEQQIAGLEATQKEVNDFIDLTINRDNAAAQEIIKAKKDFYKEYDYLKPDSEKSDWEKFCDTLKDVGEWCKEHWKFIVTVVIVIAAVILLVSGVGTGLGAAILAGACWGAICGAVVGGVAGGIMSSLQGGSFFEGFENGAFDGAIGGAIGGAITGGLTAALGPATTMLQSVARGAGMGALSTGTSNMAVTAINYGVANGTLDGALSEIIMSGIVGLVTGGVIGGVTGGIQFKIIDSIKAYSGDGCYQNINNSLRQLEELDNVNISKVKFMHKGLSKSALKKDMILYRGTSTEALGSLKGLPPDELVGEIITEKAFMSTSTTRSVANGTFSGNMQMTITAPKGAHGASISHISQYASENEILFDCGQKMIITSAEYIGDILHINVEIII